MSELRDEYLALRFAAGPLLVWTLSHVVFESVAFDLDAVGAQVAGLLEARDARMPVAPALESGTRILWAASLLAFVVIALAVLAYSVWLLGTRLSRRATRLYAGLALALCAASLAHAVASSALRNAFSMIYYFTHDALHACACYGASELRTIDLAVMSLNVLAAIVPPLALMAGCSALVLPRGGGAEEIAEMERRMTQLKTILAGGSALLVTGVLHQYLWQHWPAVLTGGDATLAGFVQSMSLYWGLTYSLLVVAFYVPPAWVMHRRARTILEQQPALTGGEPPDAWLASRGLSRAAIHRLPQLAAMIAPALAGPVGATLSGFGDVLFVG